MADLSVTAASVLASRAAKIVRGTAGATITAGQALYIDTANSGVLKLHDTDVAAPANVFAGIALNGASTGQPVEYVISDPSFTPGFTALAGDAIWASDTAGGVTKTFAELEAGDVGTVLGSMLTTTTMNFNPTIGGQIA